MTTIRNKCLLKRSGLRGALVLVVATALAGCETGSTALSGAQPATTLANNVAPPPAAPLTKVTIAPVIGAPDTVGRSLSQEMVGQIGKHQAQVVSAGERSDYILRGYLVAAKDKAATKVSYIWDVTDPTGKRLNRITGDELIPGTTPKDPWTAVTPQVMTSIAQKTGASFGAWLPSQTGSAASTPIASAPTAIGAQGAAPVQTASVGAAAAASATQKSQPAVPASAPAAGGPVSAVVPSVTGAPGDGSTSLAQALQSELTKSGVASAAAAAPNAYRVEGVVKLTAGQAGRQSIKIDWNVKDPQGKRLGTVSQQNEIPEGSLDGAWGQTASDAAAAATQGILKLLPR